MTLDEPIEDLDNLDDETALDNYLGGDAVTGDAGSVNLPDWPTPAKRETGLDLDVETLNWFKHSHVDWRREMRFVLRAWVAAKATRSRTAAVPGPAAVWQEADAP